MVTETNFKLPILGEEIFYFGFAEGDQVLFSFEEQNGKDLKEVEIVELPSNSLYKEFKTSKIQNKTLTVPRTGIYQFRFLNSVLMQKICRLKIQRIPPVLLHKILILLCIGARCMILLIVRHNSKL